MKTFSLILAACVLFGLSGCATYDPARLDDMDYRLTRLEKKVLVQPEPAAEAFIAESIASEAETQETRGPVVVIPDSPTKTDIQQTLKNAGYYDGVVDGKFGPQTKAAIQAFQDANNLVADGKAGVNTWEKLRVFYTPPSEEE